MKICHSIVLLFLIASTAHSFDLVKSFYSMPRKAKDAHIHTYKPIRTEDVFYKGEMAKERMLQRL
jgi:hypothetical protein